MQLTYSSLVRNYRQLASKLLSLGIAVTATLAIAPNSLAASFADFLFIVDESGSMQNEQVWLQTMIYDLESSLQSNGVGTGVEANRFGLVGFGGKNEGYPHTFDLDLFTPGVQSFGSANLFADATSKLTTMGDYEDGYEAINVALDQYSFRKDAAVNVVLISDEGRSTHNKRSDEFNYELTLTALKRKNALLNVVVNQNLSDDNEHSAIGIDFAGNAFIPDGNGGFTTTIATTAKENTKADYIDLAWETGGGHIGGAAWDLNILRQQGDSERSFTQAFVDIKTQEVIKQKTPEPSSILGLLIFSGIGLATLNKQKLAGKSS